MRGVWFIARRYFFSRKQRTVVNLISWISLIGIAVSTMALIVVLSVYNGIGQLTQTLFNTFDPHLMVQPTKGKTFHTAQFDYNALSQLPGVQAVGCVVEENAWMTYRHNEAIVTLRGVDTQYARITGLDTLLHEGVYLLHERLDDTTEVDYLLMGAEVYYNLGVRQMSNVPVAVHIPKRGAGIGLIPQQAFNTGYALPGGNFYIQQDIDNRYVVADIGFVRQLMIYADDECTALAVALVPSAKAKAKVKERVQTLLGDNYTVKDRFEQQPIYYKVFRSERLNLIASLSLLVMDKKKDISILRSMGMEVSQIRSIFRVEGVMIAALGVVAGLVLGFVICFVQQRFGIIKMGDNFVVSAFPVAMRWVDFLATFLMVITISSLAVLFAVRKRKF